MFSNLMLNKML